MKKLKIGIFSLTSCGGDQLSILNCENDILKILNKFSVKVFPMFKSSNFSGRLDAAFVEGSVCQKRDLDLLKNIRDRADILIGIGTCAAYGGIPAMKNYLSKDDIIKESVKSAVVDLDFMDAQPISNFVKADFEIKGCPIEESAFIETVSNLIYGNFPEFLKYPVCAECKWNENRCLITEYNEICCGPLTISGCNARCPGYGVPCAGCRGPLEEVHYRAAVDAFKFTGVTKEVILRKMSIFVPPSTFMKGVKKA